MIRVEGCYICPWSKGRGRTEDGVGLRNICGVDAGGFRHCPDIYPDSANLPIPEWCPLEDAPPLQDSTEGAGNE
jgi:hypothetical protein